MADSLFVQLGNFVLLRQNSYLDHVKNGLKPDTWNQLCNAPLFYGGLFPDAMLATAEQDITKFGSASAAQRPSPGAPQCVHPGVSSPAGAKVMDVGVPTPCYSPRRPREASRVNENYHRVDPIDSQFCSVQGW